MATPGYIDDDVVPVYKLGESRINVNLLAALSRRDKARVVASARWLPLDPPLAAAGT